MPHDMRMYWTFQDDMIDGIIMMGRHVLIPEILKTQARDQLQVNHMGIEKNKLLACKLVYWVNIDEIGTTWDLNPYVSHSG